MRYSTFGRNSGLRVSEYALGTVNFGTGPGWGAGAGDDECRRIFDRFADAGGTLIDTADCYHNGEAERLVGQCIASDRDHFVLASKYTCGAAVKPSVSGTGNSRKNMFRSVEASLTRLGTSYLDLYWVHFPDTITGIEEILSAFDQLVRSGKVLYCGLSNFPAWRVARADAIAELRGWSPVTAIQIEYSLIDRTAERELLPMADSLGLGAALWSPLAGGLLTGKYRQSGEGRLSHWNRAIHIEDSERKTIILDTVIQVAQEVGANPAQVSMAFVRERSRRCDNVLVPVIGPRSLAQTDDYLAALHVELSPEQYRRLDHASAPELGTPHEVAANVIGPLLGGDADAVYRPRLPAA